MTRFDSVLTIDDYDLKNYFKISLIKGDLLLLFAKNSILVLKAENFIDSIELEKFENIKKH